MRPTPRTGTLVTLASLVALLAAGVVAMPFLVAGENANEWWSDVAAGGVILLFAVLNLAYLAQRNVEMMHWRVVPQVLAGLALAASPLLGYTSASYAETTVAAGVVAAALAGASGYLALGVPAAQPPRGPPTA